MEKLNEMPTLVLGFTTLAVIGIVVLIFTDRLVRLVMGTFISVFLVSYGLGLFVKSIIK